MPDFWGNIRDQVDHELIDERGGPNTYEHYPTGWAAALSTQFKMFKRYSNYSGGTCDPLVICRPKGINARGEIRNQYYHAVGIVPTIPEICGLKMPDVYRGVKQYPISGASRKYTFDANPDAPNQKHPCIQLTQQEATCLEETFFSLNNDLKTFEGLNYYNEIAMSYINPVMYKACSPSEYRIHPL